MDSRKQIEDSAADWLVRRDRETWSAADEAAFERWLSASTAHEVAFLRLEAAWEEAQRLRALGAGMPPGVVPPPGQWRVSPLFELRQPVSQLHGAQASDSRRASRRHVLAAAAAVVLAVGAATYMWMFSSADRYSTPVGGLSSIPLRDGSNITLNTASKVYVDLTKDERRIDLEEGEAYFEVAHDPNRPFTVLAGHKRVIAVGTKFSVRRDHGDIEIAVTEGTVRLEDSKTPLQVNGMIVPSTLLPAGTVAEVAREQVRLATRTRRELAESLSWRAGYLIFDAEPLSRAIAEFNRYTTRKIVIEDPAVGALPISGKFRVTNAAAFTRMLHQGFGIRVEDDDGSIRLTRQ